MSDHYFSEKPKSRLKTKEIEAVLRGKCIKLLSGSGVFSIKKVDKGSELLINSAIIESGWRVLDLGCGYGVVGIAVKKSEPSIELVLSDVNIRAVRLAKDNLKLNKVEGLAVAGSSFAKVTGEFDTILLNPPQTAGKDVCFEMIETSRKFLVSGGLLQIVARHTKGGNSLSKKMEEVFGNVDVISKKSGYWIYVSKR